MIAGDYTLEVWRGNADTWYGIAYQDAAATQPTNLTGCTGEAAIRPPGGGSPQIPLTLEIPDDEDHPAAAGWFKVSITDANAALLTGSFYQWTAVIIDTLGDRNPMLKGPVNVMIDDTL